MKCLKNITITLTLVIVLFQTFATVGIIVQFQVNQSYYEAVLCINKNRPELACHGKCVLMQRLQNEFNQNQDTERQNLKNFFDREITLLCPESKPIIVHHSHLDILINTAFHPQSQNFFVQSVLSDIFHPPAHRA
jgi:hypothetical protein